jgi:tetratricopeptide (TPR) repeat protein
LRLDQVEEAEKALKAALELHTEVNDKLGQANDLQSLGDLYLRLDQVKEAEKALCEREQRAGPAHENLR